MAVQSNNSQEAADNTTDMVRHLRQEMLQSLADGEHGNTF